MGVQWLTIVRYGYELLDMGGPTKEAAVPCTDVWLTDHMCIKMATKCKVQETWFIILQAFIGLIYEKLIYSIA